MTTVGDHTLLAADVQAALFDVDGTLVDSMPRFYPSWNVAGAPHGIFLAEQEFYSFGGWPLPDIVRELHRRRFDGAEASEEFVKIFLECKLRAHVDAEAAEGP